MPPVNMPTQCYPCRRRSDIALSNMMDFLAGLDYGHQSKSPMDGGSGGSCGTPQAMTSA
jgi:hypothetical protein